MQLLIGFSGVLTSCRRRTATCGLMQVVGWSVARLARMAVQSKTHIPGSLLWAPPKEPEEGAAAEEAWKSQLLAPNLSCGASRATCMS